MIKKTHRHFVAVPIALVMMLAFVSVTMLVPVRAELVAAQKSVHVSATLDDEEFYLGQNIAGMLKAGTKLSADPIGTRLSLNSGQALLRTSGFMKLDIDTVQVSALHGSFVAAKDAQTIMIAALDAPVILVSDEFSLVLAPRMQVLLKKDVSYTLSSIGREWYSTQMQSLSSLRPASKQSIEQNMIDDACAQEQNFSSDDAGFIVTLLGHGRITTDVYSCILRFSDTMDDAQSIRRLVVLVLATEGARIDDEAAVLILDAFEHDSVLRSSLPQVLPALVIQKRSATTPPQLIDLFSTGIIEKGLLDPVDAIALLENAISVPDTLRRSGLPLQADLWQAAITKVVTVLKSVVSDDQRVELDQLIHQTSSSSSTTFDQDVIRPQTNWTDEELILMTRNTLLDHGALFSSTTLLTADTEHQTVRIEGIFILKDNKNVRYDCTYDPTREVFTNIIREGTRLPNDVPVTIFFTS